MARAGLPWVWGATAAEHAHGHPADGVLEPPVITLTRAVSAAAPADLAYRWLCQVAVAPYSYDWVDNAGRRSPPELTPGADGLSVGQRLLGVYEVVEVEPGRSWSGRATPRAARLFGPLGVTYAAVPDGPGRSRLACRIAVPAGTRAQRIRATALAWGDLVMLRKQLLTLARYAARDASRHASGHASGQERSQGGQDGGGRAGPVDPQQP